MGLYYLSLPFQLLLITTSQLLYLKLNPNTMPTIVPHSKFIKRKRDTEKIEKTISLYLLPKYQPKRGGDLG
jgi:hypothetical protein